MQTDLVRVLLVGESAKGFSFIQKRLENRGCRCFVVAAGAEAVRMLEQASFDLVLCINKFREIERLTAAMIGCSGSLYCSSVHEDDCLWLPAVRHGQKCSGAPAMLPSEFTNALEEIVAEARTLKAAHDATTATASAA